MRTSAAAQGNSSRVLLFKIFRQANMTKKLKKELLATFAENAYEISVKRCCASCESMGPSEKLRYRKCLKHLCLVKPHNVCRDWTMNMRSKQAGASEGKVKKREYQLFLLEVREAEIKAEEQGNRVTRLSIGEIRQQFEEEHGTIYMNI